jgi:ribulose-phosphate 3-epimerase
MPKKTLIAPSLLSADFTCLGEEIAAVEAAGADWLHVDVMDGAFVPNITMGPFIVEAFRRMSRLPLDCHLMIQHPEKFVERFAEAGADWIVVHPEAEGDIAGALRMIRKTKARSGLALKPATPVEAVKHFVGLFDMLLIMTVNPGFSGQKMMPECLPKFAKARKLLGDDILLQIDGGVTAENAAEVRLAGAQCIVAATAIFKTKDYAAAIRAVRGE